MAPSLRNFLKRRSRNPLVRQKAWAKHLNRRGEPHGVHVYKGHLQWTVSAELHELEVRWGGAPGNPPDRCALLFELGRQIAARGIVGDTVECGARLGKSSFFLLSGLGSAMRPHHIFDSFAGLSSVLSEDAPPEGLKPWKAGDIAVEEEECRRNLAQFPNCRFHTGWIPERFPDVADHRFALVHIDVDLYEPTLDSLEFFWPRLTIGGVIVCDDYGFLTCPGVKRAFDEYFASRKQKPLPLPTGQVIVWKDEADPAKLQDDGS